MANKPDPHNDQGFEYTDRVKKAANVEFDRAALEKVLSETLGQNPTESIDPNGLQALGAVARRHPESKLTLKPIVVELVHSMLQCRLNRINNSPDIWHEMSLEIATALYEAPVSKTRLMNLWNALLESVT